MAKPYKGKITGAMRDPHFGDCLLVPLGEAPDHPQFPKVYGALSIPGTYYRYEEKSGKVRTMVTVMPDGTHVAWFTCGACAAEFRLCRCHQGITTPRSIEVIFDQINATRAGEDWTIHHPNYAGSRRKALRRPSGPSYTGGGVSARTTTAKPAEAPSGGRDGGRKLTRKKPGQEEQPTEVDMNKIDKAAASSAEESTKELERKLTRKPKGKSSSSKLTRKKRGKK